MARTLQSPQTLALTGVVPTYAAAPAAVDGWKIPNTGVVFVHVKNGSGVSINVTVQTQVTVGGRAVPDDVVAVAAGAEKWIGPFQAEIHNVQSGADLGMVYVDFSANATVTASVLKAR